MNFVYILLFLYQLFWWRWSIDWCGVVKVELWWHYIIVVVVDAIIIIRKTLWWYCTRGSKFLFRLAIILTNHIITATVTIVLIQQPLYFIYLNHLTLLLPFQLFVLPKRTLLFLNYRTNISALLIVLILLLTLYCRYEGIVSV